ncbi:unnamed protein product [Boreogadus saida]
MYSVAGAPRSTAEMKGQGTKVQKIPRSKVVSHWTVITVNLTRVRYMAMMAPNRAGPAGILSELEGGQGQIKRELADSSGFQAATKSLT